MICPKCGWARCVKTSCKYFQCFHCKSRVKIDSKVRVIYATNNPLDCAKMVAKYNSRFEVRK